MHDEPDARAEDRARWEKSAAGWERWRADFQRATQGVSVWMVERLRPQPGHRILELAGGLGDTGLLAAELVQPGGTVILTDGAEAMVEGARRRAEELGLRNVEARQMEAEWIDLSAASVDGVLSRWGYMLLVDPGAALRETRRVLKPVGRVALAAWTAPDDNPWIAVPARTLVARGHAEPPDPSRPGPFSFAAPGHIETLLAEAGFEDPEVETVEMTFASPSLDAYLERTIAMSGNLSTVLPTLSEAERKAWRDAVADALADHTADDGSVRIPGRTWVAAATA
jgi:ubiquinone/menaquinone biosynthesis C-methylase UbiE